MTDQDMAGKNVNLLNPVAFANLVADADKVVSF